MAEPYQSQAELAASLAQKAMADHRSRMRSIKNPVVGSQGRVVDATPYLENRYSSQQMAILWAGVNEHPERFLKDPKPGYHYGFVSMKDLSAQGRIRSGRYKKILPADMREDTDLPWSTHKSPTGEMVLVYDTFLVGIPPAVWEQDYLGREAKSLAALAGIRDNFSAGVESQGGNDAAIETKVHRPG